MTDKMFEACFRRFDDDGSGVISKDEMLARSAKPVPIGRPNTPEDIAAMAVFLASPGARNITGQSYNVDGGLVTS